MTIRTLIYRCFSGGNSSKMTVADMLERNGGDIPTGHWAKEAIIKVVDKYGIMSGFVDSTFKGNNTMTRYEFGVSCARIMQGFGLPKTGETERFLEKNGGDIPDQHWFVSALGYATSVMKIFDGNQFLGQESLNRYEMTYALVNILQLLEK